MKKILLPTIVVVLLATVVYLFGENARDNISHPRRYYDIVSKYTKEYNVDENLVYAIMRTESHFYPYATSKAKCYGLMQVSEETFGDAKKTISITNDDIYNKDSNIQVGIWFLSKLINRFGDYRYAILAYNAGPENVSKWMSNGFLDIEKDYKDWNIPFAETRMYIDKVEKAKKYYESIK